MLLALLAQADKVSTDLTPALGQLLLQAGSFGLLCWIVVVLAPRMQKDAAAERRERDLLNAQTLKLLQDGFDLRSKEMNLGLKEQTVTICTEIRQNTSKTVEAMDRICNYEGGRRND